MDKVIVSWNTRITSRSSAAWKAKCKELWKQLEDVSNEWEAERDRYQEQLKRVEEIEGIAERRLWLLNNSVAFGQEEARRCAELEEACKHASGWLQAYLNLVDKPTRLTSPAKIVIMLESALEGKGGEDAP